MSEKLWLHKKINSLTALRIIFFLLISIAQKHLNNIPDITKSRKSNTNE